MLFKESNNSNSTLFNENEIRERQYHSSFYANRRNLVDRMIEGVAEEWESEGLADYCNSEGTCQNRKDGNTD